MIKLLRSTHSCLRFSLKTGQSLISANQFLLFAEMSGVLEKNVLVISSMFFDGFSGFLKISN